MASIVALRHPTLALGFVSLSGRADLATMRSTYSATAQELVCSAPLRDGGACWSENSPLRHASAGSPPALLVHGTGDALVPFAPNSLRLHRALQSVGAASLLVALPRSNHYYAFVPGSVGQQLAIQMLARFVAALG